MPPACSHRQISSRLCYSRFATNSQTKQTAKDLKLHRTWEFLGAHVCWFMSIWHVSVRKRTYSCSTGGLVCVHVCVQDRGECQVNCFSIFYLHFWNSIVLNLEFTAADRSSRQWAPRTSCLRLIYQAHWGFRQLSGAWLCVGAENPNSGTQHFRERTLAPDPSSALLGVILKFMEAWAWTKKYWFKCSWHAVT